MTTKEKILHTSLQLFNEHGFENITVRDIAKAMNISHGNLCYHFANVNVIAYKLYEGLVAEIDTNLAEIQPEKINLEVVLQSLFHTYTVLYKYKFLLSDFVNILRKIESIKTHFRQLMEKRKQQMSFLLQLLILNGTLRKEIVPNQYRDFVQVSISIGNFWISDAEIMYQGEENQKIKYYVMRFFNQIAFFLTEKGLEEHQLLINKYLSK
jgi:AcrR family transcriptional regulator